MGSYYTPWFIYFSWTVIIIVNNHCKQFTNEYIAYENIHEMYLISKIHERCIVQDNSPMFITSVEYVFLWLDLFPTQWTDSQMCWSSVFGSKYGFVKPRSQRENR